ncbi:hypothetical protein E4188_23925 (plasmid) [Aeromonas media]|uniref:Uncharacterized protein n=3 Tax=Aeromonas TaxID=642 RepID=A0ABX6P0B6_AERME|nr:MULTISPECIES: hypothetical protein [Aeromonas]QJT41541.1 hypothetical protein E4188_23925 [Aeromonas media]QLI59059.1 hypothetical protein C0708_23210 [Aeromonas caviae]QLI60287.1 hypothetical protein C1C91_22860 [Aeromonas caviae]HDN9373744.1 hypothetical protein [Aeromonas salmonicida]HDN9378867.1 hypothetical protein [Aeromonas salmonicida]
MGILIINSGDPMVLPQISSNAFGDESWSGVHVKQLSSEQKEQITRYCRTEGRRQGWNDANGQRMGERREGPFHPELLGGEPCREWQDSYDNGVEEQRRLSVM